MAAERMKPLRKGGGIDRETFIALHRENDESATHVTDIGRLKIICKNKIS